MEASENPGGLEVVPKKQGSGFGTFGNQSFKTVHGENIVLQVHLRREKSDDAQDQQMSNPLDTLSQSLRYLVEGIPDLVIGILIEWVEVTSYGSSEESWVLHIWDGRWQCQARLVRGRHTTR